jgi:PIN domain nuclease of toxin-antitoxin system
VSAASTIRARRLRFDIPCEEWVEQAFGLPGLFLMPVTPLICFRSSRLPGVFHGDPAPANDLWIAALVVQHDLLLFSRDSHFDRLPQRARA